MFVRKIVVVIMNYLSFMKIEGGGGRFGSGGASGSW